MDVNNVISWNDRPKRTRKPPPKTYWEEYVETDQWYCKKLIEDVPPEELYAAIEDTDLDGDEVMSEEGDETESEENEGDDDAEFLGEEENSDGDETVSTMSDECATECAESDDDDYRPPPRRGTTQTDVQRTP
jgi:hypothetical protein